MGRNRNVEIWATPDANAQQGYSFEMKENGNGVTTLTFNKDKDGMKKADFYTIDFVLKNKGPKKDDLRFSKDINTVMWAKPVSLPTDPCPSTQSQMSGIFYVDTNSPIEDEKLTVINTDPSIQLFKFAFNFLRPGESDPSTNYVWYDPIGSNENGGTGVDDEGYASSSSSMSIGGAAAGAVVGALVPLLIIETASVTELLWGAAIGAVIGFFVGQFLGKRRESRPA